jgi:anaerobic magnesium-protoporphyrin IX monomethyl ester cyclase
VFLGIESGSQHNLDIMNKGYSATKTKEVVSALHAQGIVTLGGFIVGNPDDRPENIRDVFRFAREIGVDHAIVQCLTPYPKTEIREQLAQAGLISNPEGFASYNGFIANVKTRHMSSLQLARETVKAGIPYYMNPSRMNTSLMWKYSKSAVWTLLLNNLKFIYSGWRNRMFASTHKF